IGSSRNCDAGAVPYGKNRFSASARFSSRCQLTQATTTDAPPASTRNPRFAKTKEPRTGLVHHACATRGMSANATERCTTYSPYESCGATRGGGLARAPRRGAAGGGPSRKRGGAPNPGAGGDPRGVRGGPPKGGARWGGG